jgi:hypothetical protein
MKWFYVLCFTLLSGISLHASAEDTITVAAKILDPVTAENRATKYEEPLDATLKEAKLGEVTGGGNSVGKGGKIEWAGVDIEVSDVQKAIPLIKQKLVELGAPKGSSLEYRIGAKRVVVPIQ